VVSSATLAPDNVSQHNRIRIVCPRRETVARRIADARA
jgi:hypothetical protein